MRNNVSTGRAILLLLQVSSIGLSLTPHAQGSITGFLLYKEGKPLVQANVLLLSAADSVLIKGAVTSATGQYLFRDIKPGHYLIAATFTGLKQTYTSPFELKSKETKQLAPLHLIEKEVELGNVTVEAKKPLFEQKADRLVVNVGSSITATGSSALEVLMRSPGIMVDQQNNTISMNGKDGVLLMMNGKISRMPLSAVVQMLAGMNAGNIDRIELISTPPANLDAEGNAGYINIVMKTNQQFGTNGSYSITMGYGKKPLGAASFNFNHRKNKWNLFGDYASAYTGFTQSFDINRQIRKGQDAIETDIHTGRHAARITHNGRVGVDYEFSSKTTFGFLLSAFSNLYKMDALNESRILLNRQLDTAIFINNAEDHPIYNYTTNINFYHLFNADQKLSLNLDYVYYWDANFTDYINQYYKGNSAFLFNTTNRSSKETPIGFWVASADYTTRLGKKANLETGLKTTYSTFTNDVWFEAQRQNNWVRDNTLSAVYNLKENIHAAYATANVNVHEKTTFKLGLRFEQTASNLGSAKQKNIVDRNYGNLFPTFYLTHRFDENNTLNVSFNRRINRPTFNDMAPFVYFVDPNTLFSGNPALQPAIANAVEASYVLKNFIFTLRYSYDTDPITNFAPRILVESNQHILAAENQKNRQTAEVNFTLPVKIASWWNVQNNLMGTWQLLNAVYLNEPLQIERNNFSANTTHTLTLPKNYAIELTAFYVSGGMFGIYQVKGFGSGNVGVQKKLQNNKGTFRLAVDNFWGPPKFENSINQPQKNLVITSTIAPTNTFYKMSYNRNFGSDKIKQKRVRSTASEEERLRVNTN